MLSCARARHTEINDYFLGPKVDQAEGAPLTHGGSKGVLRGKPVIAGTKRPVPSVVNYVLLEGITPEALATEFHHLMLAQCDHATLTITTIRMIERDTAANTEGSGRSQLGAERGAHSPGKLELLTERRVSDPPRSGPHGACLHSPPTTASVERTPGWLQRPATAMAGQGLAQA